MKITKATRWRVFAGVWIQSLFTSATAFFSLFSLPMCSQFGWSSSDFSMAYTIYMFIYCAVGFLGGILAEKLQPRVAIYLGLILFAGGWILTGFADSIPFLYIAYGVIAGAGAGTIYPACLPTALKWFPDKSGSISGLVQAGAACGPFIMSPIAQMLIDSFGAQQACRILGVVFLIGVGAVAWMIVPCPDGWTPEGWVPSKNQSRELNTKNYNIPQMIKQPVFWVLLVMFIFANAAGTMMVSATSPIAQNQIGLSAMTAALCVSLMTLFNMFGRIAFGFIYDRLQGWNSLILILVINGISMLMLTAAGSYAYFILCIALVGFHGENHLRLQILQPELRPDLHRLRHRRLRGTEDLLQLLRRHRLLCDGLLRLRCAGRRRHPAGAGCQAHDKADGAESNYAARKNCRHTPRRQSVIPAFSTALAATTGRVPNSFPSNV